MEDGSFPESSPPSGHFALGSQKYVVVAPFLGSFKVHIRQYVVDESLLCRPSKIGVVMSPYAWECFSEKAERFDIDEVMVCEPELVVSAKFPQLPECHSEMDRQFQHHTIQLQRMFQRSDGGHQFAPAFVTLTSEEFQTLSLCNHIGIRMYKKVKASPYWGEIGESKTYDDITVTLLETHQKHAAYLIRKISLTKVPSRLNQEEGSIILKQYHFLKWFDGAIPDLEYFYSYYMEICEEINSKTNPIAVHCSAAQGRTGTFLMISKLLDLIVGRPDAGLQPVSDDEKIDVPGVLWELRTRRAKLIESPEQYVFALKFVQYFLLRFED